jgi:predicted nucleic acid-binding protein
LKTNCLIISNTIIENFPINISVITRIELLFWNRATKTQSEIIKRFIEASKIYGLEEDIIVNTIDIRRQKHMKLPDAIIAATSIVEDMILITNDANAFSSFSKIRKMIVKI